MSVVFTWQVPPQLLIDNLDAFEEELQDALRQMLADFAGKAESWMKSNAPWNDRTGAARAGLTAVAADLALHLMHTVYYGVYLELGTSKMAPRPIIQPAMQEFGAEVMQAARALVGG